MTDNDDSLKKTNIDTLIKQVNNISLNGNINKSDDIDIVDTGKNKIIQLFNENIRGKIITKNKSEHCGAIGHKLEKLMNIKPNSNNAPDIYGYEMKKNSSKITFGDWSASEYIFNKEKQLIDKLNGESIKNIDKKVFMKIFGTPNKNKNNRLSWSGKCIPKYNQWNDCGQKLIVDDKDNISIIYSYDKDKRETKEILCNYTDKKIITIAIWKKNKMRKHVNSKYNQKGFFICKTDKDGIYNKICFGCPITFEIFIKNIKDGIIYFDSGMYDGNSRLYSQWRASSKFWNKLIIEEY
jgi:hypothetical protein